MVLANPGTALNYNKTAEWKPKDIFSARITQYKTTIQLKTQLELKNKLSNKQVNQTCRNEETAAQDAIKNIIKVIFF